MFKPELWQSHDKYKTIVTKIDHRLSRNNPKYSFDSFEEEHQKLLNLNLDPLIEYILFVLLFNKTKARVSLTSCVST